jgi:hypothetical protein
MNILYFSHYVSAPALGQECRLHYLAREWVCVGYSTMAPLRASKIWFRRS